VRGRSRLRERTRRTAFVVGPFGTGTRTAGPDQPLPYGAHHLAEHGYDVTYADSSATWVERTRLGRLFMRASNRVLGGPALNVLLEPIRVLRSDLLISIFEDNLRVLAPMARLRRRPSVLIVCWLAEDLRTIGPRERRAWRRKLTSFDKVLVYSRNQVPILQGELDLPDGFVSAIPFGVTVRAALPDVPIEPGSVTALGTDRGRDFATFIEAVRDTPIPATIVTNFVIAERLTDVGSVQVIGPLAYEDYLREMQRAEVVVSPTQVLAYPTGQTVLLEALALGKPTIVTRSPALDDYVTDGVDTILVEAHQPAQLRNAIEQVVADKTLRDSLSAHGRETAGRFTERAMWSALVRSIPAHGRVDTGRRANV
jgi:glycosyltransferase involved in cell wall biosynthesis